MIIGFNHNYYMRHDIQRTILASGPDAVKEGYIDEWLSRIHPIYAMLFALLSIPMELEKAKQKIANFFGLSLSNAHEILNNFLNNTSIYIGEYGNCKSYFPKYIIKEYKKQEYELLLKNKERTHIYNPANFIFSDSDLNIDARRMIKCPHGLVFIVTTNCATNCIYCYADKNTECTKFLSVHDIQRILTDAKEIGIRDIQMIGGEFFLHPDWHEILSVSTKLGFNIPLVSTKLPLSEEQLMKFKEFNISLQFSLDSIDPGILMNTLNVSSKYSDKIIGSIRFADSIGIRYKISTVLTKYTAISENLSSLYKFIRSLSNIKTWSVRFAFRSLYTHQSFENIKVSDLQSKDVFSWYENIRSNENAFDIDFPESSKTTYHYAENGSCDFQGPQCSANMSHMVILPDGEVTICEQLYWNRRFIIGNIHNNSIEQIWNSNKAIALANYPKEKINSKSACLKCSIYESCRNYSNKCFANTIKAYGDNNWDYPDPRCILAPPFFNDII